MNKIILLLILGVCTYDAQAGKEFKDDENRNEKGKQKSNKKLDRRSRVAKLAEKNVQRLADRDLLEELAQLIDSEDPLTKEMTRKDVLRLINDYEDMEDKGLNKKEISEEILRKVSKFPDLSDSFPDDLPEDSINEH